MALSGMKDLAMRDVATAFKQGGTTGMGKLLRLAWPIWLPWVMPGIAKAPSFRVQCPLTTTLHPGTASDQGAIKCQQISGGDGFATMADGTQTYLFSFGPLSGLTAIANGMPGTEPADVFMTPYDPNAGPHSAAANGAVGLIPDHEALPLNNAGNNPCVVNPNRKACYTGHL